MTSFLPFLNKLVPPILAIKGISKIDPRMSKFFQGAAATGYSANAALDYLRNRFENPGSENERARLEQGEANQTLRPDEQAGLQTVRQSERIPNTIQQALVGGAGLAGGLGSLMAGNADQVTSQQPSSPLDILSQYSPELANFIGSELQKHGSALTAAANAKHNPKFKTPIQTIEAQTKNKFEDLITSLFGKQAQPAPQAQPSVQTQTPVSAQTQPDTQPTSNAQRLMQILSRRQNRP